MGKRDTFLLLFFIINRVLAFGQDQLVDSLKDALPKLQNSPQKVQLLLQISQEYQNSSLKDAVDYAGMAKDLAAQINYSQGLGNSYRFLGNSYKKLGKYSESLDAYAEGLKAFT